MLLFLSACPDTTKDGATTEPDTTPASTTCADDEDCPSGRICEAEVCTTGDRDNDPSTATAMTWDTPVEGVIQPAGDEDWWAIESDGGEFVRVQTEVAEGTDLDTVVSLYDADGNRLTWEDDHPGGAVLTYDSVCFGYFDAPGTYYVKVEDVLNFYEEDLGGEDYYTLTALHYSAISEPDAVYSAGQDSDLTSTNSWYPMAVLVEEEGDTDFAALTIPAAASPIYFIALRNAEGSTLAPLLTLYDDDAAEVMVKASPTTDSPGILLDSEGTDYVLGVGDAADASGGSAWTWVFYMVGASGDGNPRGDEPDDTVEEANVLTMEDQEPDAGDWYAGYGESRVASAEDVDVWQFDVSIEEAYVSVYIGAQVYGSLLVPRLEILDDTGEVLETVDSTPGTDEDALNLGPWPTGTYHLRVSSAESEIDGGEGYYYRFGLMTTSFELTE